MNTSFSLALEELMEWVGQTDELKAAPTDPPESMEVFPFAIAYGESGAYTAVYGSGGAMKGLHNINIEVHVGRQELPFDYALLKRLQDRIPKILMNARGGDGTKNLVYLSTWQQISYTFGPSSYSGVETLALVYTLEGVKVETDLT